MTVPVAGRYRTVHPLPVVVGALLMTVVFAASSRFALVRGSYAVYAGVVGGSFVALVAADRWDEGLELGALAGAVAVPVTVSLFVVYDVALATRYDLVLVDVGGVAGPPEGLVSMLFVYGAYEVVIGFYPLVVYLLGGMVGGTVTPLLERTVRWFLGWDGGDGTHGSEDGDRRA